MQCPILLRHLRAVGDAGPFRANIKFSPKRNEPLRLYLAPEGIAWAIAFCVLAGDSPKCSIVKSVSWPNLSNSLRVDRWLRMWRDDHMYELQTATFPDLTNLEVWWIILMCFRCIVFRYSMSECMYNDNTNAYFTIMKSTGIASILFFIFTVYVVLFHSTKAMSDYRWLLISNSLWYDNLSACYFFLHALAIGCSLYVSSITLTLEVQLYFLTAKRAWRYVGSRNHEIFVRTLMTPEKQAVVPKLLHRKTFPGSM